MVQPFVSVVIPCYNGAAYVRAAVVSAVQQTYSRLEVIVVDDGSTDDTPRTLEQLREHGVLLLKQANGGVASARNAGIAAASGDLIALLDQDDEWYPHKISQQVPLLSSDVAAVGSLMHYVGSTGKVIGVSGELADHRRQDIIAGHFMPFAPSSVLFRRADIVALGGFNEQLARWAPVDDADAISRLATLGNVVTVMEPLGRYRLHAEAGSAKQFFTIQKGAAYLTAARANPNLTIADFERSYAVGRGERVRQLGRYLYRDAGVRLASGMYVSGVLRLIVSIVLGPRYALGRLARQRGGTLRTIAARRSLKQRDT